MSIRRYAFSLVLFVFMVALSPSIVFAQAPTITTGANLGRQRLGPLHFALGATGGAAPYTFSLTPGFTQSPNFLVHNRSANDTIPSFFAASVTAALDGVATTPGTYTFSIRVTGNDNLFSDKVVTFQVPPVLLSTFAWRTLETSVNELFSYQFGGSGGVPPYSYALSPTSNPLPAGMSVSSTGLLGGTPTVSGTFVITVRITDSGAPAEFSDFQLSIHVSPLRFDSSRVLPTVTANLGYDHQLQVSGGTPPYTWSLSPGNTLPAGLRLEDDFGWVTGNTNVVTNWNTTVRVTDSVGNVIDRRILIPITNNVANPVQFNRSATFDDAVVGWVTSQALTLTGGLPPFTYTIDQGTLPPGLFLKSGLVTHVLDEPQLTYLAGVPSVPGNYSFTLRVTDSVGNFDTGVFSIKVARLAIENTNVNGLLGSFLQHRFLGLGGTPPYSWSLWDALPGGLSLHPSTGLLSGTPRDTGSYSFRIRLNDAAGNSLIQWMNIFVASGTPSTLRINLGPNLGTRMTGANTFSIQSDGSPLANPNFVYTLAPGSQLPPGYALLQGNQLGNVGQGVTAQLSGNGTTPGIYEFTIQVTDAAGNFGSRTFILRISPLVDLTNIFTLPAASVGVPYSFQFVGEGGVPPRSWSVFAPDLPPGLGLSPTGLISGTPTVPGSYLFTPGLSDSAGNQIFNSHRIDVSELNITNTDTFLTVVQGAPFSVAFNATGPGGPYVWTSTVLTAFGFTLNSATGVLSGNPAFVGQFSFNLTVGNAAGTQFFTKLFVLNSRSSASEINLAVVNLPALAEATLGNLYSVTLSGNSGKPPYTWAVKSGSSLPPGLRLVSGSDLPPNTAPGTTLLRGVPSALGTFTFTLEVADTAGLVTQRTFSLRVTPVSLGTTSLHFGTLGVPYSQQLIGVGGQEPYTFLHTAGVLPKGMTLSSSGLLSGTPETSGSYTLTFTMTDSSGTEALRSLALTINSGSNLNVTGLLAVGPQTDSSVGIFRSLFFQPSGGIAPYSISIEPGSTLPPGMGIAPGATFISGIPTTPGDYEFIVRITDSLGNFGLRPHSIHVSPLNIVTPLFFNSLTFNTAVPPARAGSPYSYSFTVVNGTTPYTFALGPGSYPVEELGLQLSPGGVLSGTPNASAVVVFNVSVTDSKGFTFTKTYAITIFPPGVSPSLVSTGSLPQGSLGESYAVELNRLITQGTPPYLFELVAGSTLPPGLTLTPGVGGSSALLNGIPTATGSFNFSLRVTDAAGRTLTGPVTLIVSTLSLQPGDMSPGMVNQPYSTAFLAGGGTAPYSFQLAFGSSMPLGMTLNSSGVLSGIPLTVGTFGFGVQVTDAESDVLTRNFQLVVTPAGVPAVSLNVSPYAISLAYVQGAPNPPPTPVTVGSLVQGVVFNAAVLGGSWATPSTNSGATPGGFFLNFDPSSLGVGTYNAVLSVSSIAAINSPRLIPITLVVSSPVPCSFSLSPLETTITAAGGSGNFSVNTGAGCNWAASTTASWLTFNGGNSGTGTGAANFTAAANPGSTPRTATINVAGELHTITQFGTAVSYSILPSTVSVPAAGGVGNFNLVASSASAPWTASPTVPWITILTSPPSGIGSAALEIAVEANPGLTSRSGGVSVAGLTFTVNQDAAGCTFTPFPSAASVSYNGGDISTDLSTAAGCFSSVNNLPSWVTIVSGGSGSGPRTVTLNVAPNTSIQSRATNISIGGQAFGITQGGVPCSFTLTSSNPIRPASASTGNVTIRTAGSGCTWTATDNVPWITNVSPASGTGDGVVTFSILSNPNTTSRTGTITLAGQNLLITQAGTTCTFALQSASASADAVGGDSSAGVLAASGCSWTARSNAPWLVITAGTSGAGAGNVAFNIQPNITGATRIGTLTVAGQTFTVTQTGAVCNITLNTTSQLLTEAGGAGSFTFAATGAGCVPAIQSLAGWITITSTTFDGSTGAVNFSAAPNVTPSNRSGTIAVADESFTVQEAPAVCNYALASTGAVFDRFGGEGTADFALTSGTATPCTPVVGIFPGFGVGLHLGGLSGTGPDYSQFYSVDPYQTFVRWVRTLILSIGGQNFTIKQNSF